MLKNIAFSWVLVNFTPLSCFYNNRGATMIKYILIVILISLNIVISFPNNNKAHSQVNNSCSNEILCIKNL